MAAEDKKISLLTSETVNIDNMPNDLYIPVVCLGITKKINLKLVINSILSKIAAITPYESGQGAGSIDLADITTILNLYSDLNVKVEHLRESTTWPKHVLRLTDGSRAVDYELKTCPDVGGTTITIKSNEVTIPNFYVALGVNSATISGTTVTVGTTFSAQNYFSNLSLEGGQIGEVSITGSAVVMYANGSTGTVELNDYTADFSLEGDFNLTKGTMKGNSVTINLTYTSVNTLLSVLSVTLNGTVNGKAIPNQAMYSVPNNSGSAAAGYITL